MAMRFTTTRFNLNVTQTASTRRQVRVNAASQPSMKSFDSPNSQNGAVAAPLRETSAIIKESTPKSYNVSLFDALKFNGPAPEKINSRLAMMAILLAANREMETGEIVLQQLQHPDWRVIIGMLLIIHGTMIQCYKGAKDEDFGIFSVTAERVNGRLAMLGFAGLLGLEWYSNVPFF